MITKKNECPKCGKIYILPGSLKTHLLSHANDNKFTCSECLMTFITEAQLEDHILCHSKTPNGNIIKLSNNNKFVKQTAKTKAHLNDNKVEESTKKDEIGRSLKELVSIYQKLLKCTRCPLTFICKNDLENHLASHSDDFYPRLTGCGTGGVIMEKSVLAGNLKYYSKNNISSESVANRNDYFQIPVPDNSSVNRPVYDSSQNFKSKEYSVVSDKGDDLEKCKISKIASYDNACVDPTLFSSDGTVECNESLTSKGHVEMQEIFNKPNVGHQHVSVQSKCSADESKTGNSVTFANSSISGYFLTSEENANGMCLPGRENCDLESRKSIFSKSVFDDKISSGQTENDIDLTKMYSSLLSNFSSLIDGKLVLDSDGSLQSVETDTASDYCTLFKCLMCPMIFLMKEDIDNHLHIHKEEFRIKNNISREHKERTDKPKENFSSNDKNEKSVILRVMGNIYKIHLKKVYMRYYKCLKCPLVFLSRLEVQKHTSVHVQDVNLTEDNVGCDNNSFEISVNCSETKESKSLSTVYCPIFHCLGCKMIFWSKSDYESHSSQHGEELLSELITEVGSTGLAGTSSGNISFYSCSICGKKFKNRSKYLDHKQIHVKRFTCRECGKICKSHFYLKKHMKVHSLPYKCTKCSKSFKSDYVLELHQSMHSDVMPYECKECGNVFRNKISLTLHSYEHLTSGPFNCEICKACFENSQILKSHIQTHLSETSEEEKSFTCTKCDQTFSDRKNFQQHLLCHSKRRTFKCKLCKRFFKDKYLLVKHLVIHRGEEHPYQCSICQRRFSMKSSLNSHLDTHSTDKQYLCHICGVSLNQRSSYYTHIRKHAGMMYHQCDICGKRFFHKGSFKRHISMHYGRKPYQCESCGKSFKQKAHLKGHLVTHTGEKPFECKICHKGFTQKSSLKIHQLTHSSGQYMCPDCGRLFTQKSTLLNHMKKDLSGKSYCCDLCMKKFMRRTCYLHHKRMHHLQGTCVIEFDGSREIIENYVDSSVDEVKEIIINEDICGTGEEIIETQSADVREHNVEEIPQNGSESDTIFLDSNEVKTLLIESDSQTLEFSSLVSQEFDFSSHIMQAFDFSSPNSQVPNFDIQEISFCNANASFTASSHNPPVFVASSQDGDAVTSSNSGAQSLLFNSLDAQNLAFDMKDTQAFAFALPESDLLQESQPVIFTVPGNKSLPFDEREEIVVTQDDKEEGDDEAMQIHFVF